MVSKRGSILIIVLWSLFFLAALALAIDSYVRPRLNLGGRLLREARIHYYAVAGVKQAMLELERDDTELYDSFNDSYYIDKQELEKKLDGGEFKVRLTDESGKINLNKATKDILVNILEIFAETSSGEAEELSDSILDWRDEDDDVRDNGAEDGYYSMHHPGYECKNADFELIEELLLVKNMTTEIFDKIKPRVTVYGEGTVNINVVDAAMLECLGMSEGLASKIISYRGGIGDEYGIVDHVFERAGDIIIKLQDEYTLSTSEINEINKIYAKGLFGVRSDVYSGVSQGKIAGRDDLSVINFVYDRAQRRMKFWRET